MGYKTILEFPDYEINDIGIVRKKHNKKILKQQIDKDGYYRVSLFKNKKVFFKPVHRLVAITFVENQLNKPCVNHKDENKLNNCVSNLEWVTVAENNKYGTRTLRSSIKQGKVIEQYSLSGKLINTFHSIREAARKINKSSGNISRCCNGKSNTSYGYVWKFKEVV